MRVRCGDIHGMTALPVILTMLLVRIWSFGFYETCTRKMGHEKNCQSLFSLGAFSGFKVQDPVQEHYGKTKRRLIRG